MIEGIPIVQFGPEAIVAFVVLLVLTDKLVWFRRLRVLEERIAIQDKLINDLTQQNSLLLNSAVPTVDHVLRALHSAANEAD